MLPVVVNDFAQAFHDVRMMDLDGELAPAIEAARCEIDGTNDGAGMIGEDHFAVEFEVLEFVDLMPKSAKMGSPPAASVSFSFLSLWGGLTMT